MTVGHLDSRAGMSVLISIVSISLNHLTIVLSHPEKQSRLHGEISKPLTTRITGGGSELLIQNTLTAAAPAYAMVRWLRAS